jgi:hypothetical protein
MFCLSRFCWRSIIIRNRLEVQGTYSKENLKKKGLISKWTGRKKRCTGEEFTEKLAPMRFNGHQCYGHWQSTDAPQRVEFCTTARDKVIDAGTSGLRWWQELIWWPRPSFEMERWRVQTKITGRACEDQRPQKSGNKNTLT